MIDVVSGGRTDWNEIWLQSQEHEAVVEELEKLKQRNRDQKSYMEEDEYQFAATEATQFRVVSKRASVQMWRNVDYIINKFALHIATGLLNGFSFFKLVSLSARSYRRSRSHTTFRELHTRTCRTACSLSLDSSL